MIEDSVNQTFSRTIRTTATVLLTVIVLFAMNLGQRSMLEGRSFTLMFGMVAGVYSTVAVAAPLLLFLPWFWARIRAYRPRTWALTWAFQAPGTWILAGASVVALAAAFALTPASHESRLMLAVFWGLVAVPFGATLGLWMLWLAAFGLGSFVAACALLIPWSFLEDPERAVEEARRAGLLPEPVAPAPGPPRGRAPEREEEPGEAGA